MATPSFYITIYSKLKFYPMVYINIRKQDDISYTRETDNLTDNLTPGGGLRWSKNQLL